MARLALPRFQQLEDKWLVLVSVTIGMFISLLDSTIVNVAVPQLQADFAANLEAVQWVITIYMLTQAAVIPTAPFLVRRLGGKRAYIWSLVAFLAASLLCALAWDVHSLIVFRLLQGIGGGTMLPLVMTLLYQAFPANERGRAVSIMGVPLMVAPMLGPVVGGFLVGSFGWQWAFLINLPLGIVAVILSQRALRPDTSQPDARFDGMGFLAAACGSALLLFAASQFAVNSQPVYLAGIIGGIALLGAFAAIELRLVRQGRTPLLDMRRFGDRVFRWSVITNMFAGFSRFGILFLLPIYLQNIRQMSAFHSGIVLGVQALATLLILPLGGRFADRFGPRPVVLVGMAAFASAAALLATQQAETPLPLVLANLMLLGGAFGLSQQIPVAAMSQIDKDQHAEIANGSTLVSVLHAFAAPMGVAIISSLVAARSAMYAVSLAATGVAGEALARQSELLAMHEGVLVATVVVVCGLVTMALAPKVMH